MKPFHVLGNLSGTLLLHNLGCNDVIPHITKESKMMGSNHFFFRGQDSAKFLNLERDESGSRDG